MKKILNKKGSSLIVVILLMGLLLSLSLYYLTFSSTEKKISDSQFKGLETYHLAEAGIEEIIWRLKNNETYKNNFETDSNWSVGFTQNEPFGPGNGSYEVSLKNTGLAQGNIVSTGTILTMSGSFSQRVVKTSVYKAIASSSDVSGIGILTGNDISIFLSDVNVSTSSVHSNHDIDVSGWGTDFNIEHDLRAVNDYNKSFWADVNVGGDILDSGSPSPPEEVEMPPVSFDAPGDPNSYKARADIVYSEEDFEDLIDNADGGSLILDSDITYIEGDAIFNENVDVTINGLLVADGDIVLGKACWFIFCCSNYTDLIINHESSKPSGLVANGDIKFDFCVKSADINGILYATKDFSFSDFSDDVVINGGIFAREFGVFSVWQDLTINYNEINVNDSLENTEFSPVVSVEHWEEEY